MQGELGQRTWRWFTVMLSGLSAESAWSHTIWPVNPDTGERSRAASVQLIDDEDAVEAFFARQAG